MSEYFSNKKIAEEYVVLAKKILDSNTALSITFTIDGKIVIAPVL